MTDPVQPDPVQPSWLHRPPQVQVGPTSLRVTTARDTDFWQNTFYGFRHDNGHFLAHHVHGDFSAEVTVRGHYQALYDQAGLMLRVSASCWLKAGIEFSDGVQNFSVVVTRPADADQPFSDWSLVPLHASPEEISLRLTRHGEALRVQYRLPDRPWQMARLAYLPMPPAVTIGPMCCSPTRAGFEAEFHRFVISPPVARELHE